MGTRWVGTTVVPMGRWMAVQRVVWWESTRAVQRVASRD